MVESLESMISDIILKEGGFVNNKADKGGATIWGISSVSNPEAWKNGPPTEEEARKIFETKYFLTPGFNKIQDPQLRAQITDFGVVSGPGLAIMKLQEILHEKVDGILGPHTLAAIDTFEPGALNKLLVISRIKMICRLVQKRPSDIVFLTGWCVRALSFL